MKNVTNQFLSIIVFSLFAASSFAVDVNLEKARKNIVKQFDGVDPKNITISPVPGLYQVSMPPRFFYASEDGRYIVDGDLIDITTKQNISKGERNSSIATAVNDMGENSMIIFGKNNLKHTITVFTDIDCGYCRKLHSEVKKYNQAGIRIRYMAYPRAGIRSSAFKKAEAVWCSEDKNKAMTDSKNGVSIKVTKCRNPVAEHYALGNMIGIRGTPAIILDDGEVIPGYIPATRLSAILNEK